MSGRQHVPVTEEAPGLAGGSTEGPATADFGSNAGQQAAMGTDPRLRVVLMLQAGIPDWAAFCEAVGPLPDDEWQSLMKNPIWSAIYDEAAAQNGSGEGEEEEAAEAAAEEEAPSEAAEEAAEEVAEPAPVEEEAAEEEDEEHSISAPRSFKADRTVTSAMARYQKQAVAQMVTTIEKYVAEFIGDAAEYDAENELPYYRSLDSEWVMAEGITPLWGTLDALELDGDQTVSFNGHRVGTIDPLGLHAGYVWNEFRGEATATIDTVVSVDGRRGLQWSERQDVALDWKGTSALLGGAPDVEVQSKG